MSASSPSGEMKYKICWYDYYKESPISGFFPCNLALPPSGVVRS